jgi:hypothetical protein
LGGAHAHTISVLPRQVLSLAMYNAMQARGLDAEAPIWYNMQHVSVIFCEILYEMWHEREREREREEKRKKEKKKKIFTIKFYLFFIFSIIIILKKVCDSKFWKLAIN